MEYGAIPFFEDLKTEQQKSVTADIS
jgi:hypothetical protein